MTIISCPQCGTQIEREEPQRVLPNGDSLPRPIHNNLALVILLIGIVALGGVAIGYQFGAQNPKLVYVTQTQPAQIVMQTVVSYSTETQTSISQVTQQEYVTQTQNAPYYGGQYYSQGGCSYPFDAYYCAMQMGDLPPQTIAGWLTTDGSCYFLYDAGNNAIGTESFALYNMPSNVTSLLSHPVQVYGYVYPNWSQSQVFPPFQPFTYSTPLCVGTPIWVLQGPVLF